MSGNQCFSDQKTIVGPLLQWFRQTNRDLPWRRTYNPYHVWISEIMLQQTQMERGVTYFLRWIDRFPTVYEVAVAADLEILKYWEGLGYYRRARNLHKAAQIIVSQFGGKVPCDYQLLLKLPGIGPYTAAAIASVAGNADIAVLDANVTRVYSRIFNICQPVKEQKTKSRLLEIAGRMLPQGRARAYNQALMDLGGLICTPKKPRCLYCPISQSCKAFQAGTVDKRPVVEPKKKIISLVKVAGLILFEGRIFIQQRKASDVWGGLWEFPGGEIDETDPEGQLVQIILEDCGLQVTVSQFLTQITHQYTHHKIRLLCYLCHLSGESGMPDLKSASDYHWVTEKDLNKYPFPAGPRKFLDYIRKEQPGVLRF